MDKNEQHKPIFFVFFLDRMGDRQEEFDTSYSIQTAEEKKYKKMTIFIAYQNRNLGLKRNAFFPIDH